MPSRASEAPGSTFGELKRRGNDFLSHGKLAEAADCYKQMIDLDPASAEGHLNLGFVLKEQGFHADARNHLERAVSLDENAVDAVYLLGAVCQAGGDLPGAIARFERVLEMNPGFAIAYCDLCRVLYESGQKEAAREIIAKGARTHPQFADIHFSRGNLHYLDGAIDSAVDAYRMAISIRPDYADAHYNLANILREQGSMSEAEAHYRAVLAINPGFIDAHLVLARMLEGLNRLEAAEEHFRKALDIDAEHADATLSLGNIALKQGKTAEAVERYRRVCEIEPGNHGVRHLIAALSGENPEYGSSQYVQKLFDNYANSFDTHLVKELEYVGPEKLVALIRRHAEPPPAKWDVLDLGCGTGLVGSAIAADKCRLVGVDLSPGMLEKARALNLYDRLEQADLLVMMRSEKASSYDVIIAADVFIYVGRLDEIFAEAKRLLRPGGRFAFSVEAGESSSAGDEAVGAGYRLTTTARYVHTVDYLDRLSHLNGFRKLEIMSSPVRVDHGKPVPAWFALLEADDR
ncbi:MAG TPA: tetratricopeptide repeat protein [Paucimonas sp.]|nr:tetratricopeptide repeat protein [Paucimonas sp.]